MVQSLYIINCDLINLEFLLCVWAQGTGEKKKKKEWSQKPYSSLKLPFTVYLEFLMRKDKMGHTFDSAIKSPLGMCVSYI